MIRPDANRKTILFCLFLLLLVAAFYPHPAQGAVESQQLQTTGHETIGRELPIWSILPFVGLLLSIALGPLAMPHFWHRHYGKISACWAVLFAVPFLFAFPGTAVREIVHVFLVDYIPFIILLWSLFTISGGIVIGGDLKGTPFFNTIMLLIGTILASWVGTTGAAMIMIRPVLKANRDRLRKAHLICFFIFLVANIGGALTPLGDPPLFLGFLHNVPFFWVTVNLYSHMFFSAGILLVLFYFVDRFHFRKEEVKGQEKAHTGVRIKIEGLINFTFLAGVIVAILISGYWQHGHIDLLGTRIQYQNLFRDIVILIMGFLSLYFTPAQYREANDFGWAPMKEVAKIFAGIFVTIIPALAILRAGNEGALSWIISSIRGPFHYFWVSGFLSSFLDNAPTYLTFFNTALAKLRMTEAMIPAALDVTGAACNVEFIGYLKAISAGSVFMGANTYIGNAPNFMIKSIAEEAGIIMPSFFGYIFKYSLPILIPVFILVSWIFF
ncbi:MAG: sodium:proton antiporter [Syntrophales bacterium]